MKQIKTLLTKIRKDDTQPKKVDISTEKVDISTETLKDQLQKVVDNLMRCRRMTRSRIDLQELEDRFGKYVRFVVEDMMSGEEKRWKKNRVIDVIEKLKAQIEQLEVVYCDECQERFCENCQARIDEQIDEF